MLLFLARKIVTVSLRCNGNVNDPKEIRTPIFPPLL
jgi:hypothetical protein